MSDLTCPECGGEPIGVEVPMVYDGVLFWQCQADPFHRWHRFSPESAYYPRAERYLRMTSIHVDGCDGS